MRLKREMQGAFCVLNANAKSQTRKSMKINVICTVIVCFLLTNFDHFVGVLYYHLFHMCLTLDILTIMRKAIDKNNNLGSTIFIMLTEVKKNTQN